MLKLGVLWPEVAVEVAPGEPTSRSVNASLRAFRTAASWREGVSDRPAPVCSTADSLLQVFSVSEFSALLLQDLAAGSLGGWGQQARRNRRSPCEPAGASSSSMPKASSMALGPSADASLQARRWARHWSSAPSSSRMDPTLTMWDLLGALLQWRSAIGAVPPAAPAWTP